MKVKALIKKLQKVPENYVVILASDPDGNEFHNLEFATAGHAEHACGEWNLLDDEYAKEEGVKENCVVLWP